MNNVEKILFRQFFKVARSFEIATTKLVEDSMHYQPIEQHERFGEKQISKYVTQLLGLIT